MALAVVNYATLSVDSSEWIDSVRRKREEPSVDVVGFDGGTVWTIEAVQMVIRSDTGDQGDG